MKTRIIFLILILTSFCSFSQKIDLKTFQNNQKSSYSKIDKNNFEIYVPIKFIELKENISKNGNFVDLKNPDLVRSYKIGYPNLPVYSKLIEIPQDAVVNITIVSYDEETIELNKNGIKNQIYPAQAPVSKSSNPIDEPFNINKSIYSSNSFYGETNIANFELIGQMRAQQLGRIQINPFKYNPVTNQLKVYNNIVVKISFTNADWTKTDLLKQKYASPFFQNSEESIINDLKSNTKELIQSVPVTYVIVSDPAFQSALQPFVEWKKQKGFKVIEAYTDNSAVGTTVTSIKAYLKNLYTNPAVGVNAPSFILLVGDIDKIPAKQHTEVSDSPYSDLDYAEYTGDYLPEVYYGRFSADNSTQVTDIVAKTIKYEKYQMADPSYLKQTLLVAGDDEGHEDTYGGGAIWYAANYYLNSTNDINSHTFLQSTIETWGGNTTGNLRAHDSIIANINRGVALANYTAHCGPSGWSSPVFEQSDLNNYITNTDKFGIWIGNCCQSNKFDENEAFGEIAIRKANAGVIGYIGGTQFTYWDEDYNWGVGYGSIVAQPNYTSTGLGAYDGLFHNKVNEATITSRWYITSDQLIRAGNLAVQASSSSLAPYYWVIYSLMGDPSLMPYIGIPQTMTVDISQQQAIIGNSQISGTATPFSYFGFSQNNLLIGVAQADAFGNLSVTLTSPLTADTLKLVGTAQFKQPYFQTITPIATDQPYVLTDSIISTSFENGTSGKTSIYIKNYGDNGYDAINVHANFHSTDPRITITNNSADVALVTSHETIFLQDTFSYVLNYNIPDQTIIPVTVTLTDDASTVTSSTFNLTINSPSLSSLNTDILDTQDTISICTTPKTSVAYNSTYNYNIIVSYPFLNKKLNSGEEVTLSIKTTNTGNNGIGDLYAQLSSNSSHVQIDNPIINYDTVAIGGSITSDFIIHVDKDISSEYDMNFEYVFGDTTFQDTLNFALPVNTITEDFESGDFSIFSWGTSGNQDWHVTNNNSYKDKFSAVSGNISDNQSTNLTIYLNDVKANQKFSFYYNVSSEADYDFFRLYVNDNKIKESSGTIPWENYSYTFTKDGNYKIEFVYSKDESQYGGSDCVWIDNIIFPVIPLNSGKAIACTINSTIAPSWLSFSDYGNGTALLSGTAPSQNYNEAIRIEATDGILSTYQEYNLQVSLTPITEEISEVKIFPNPTSNLLNIQLKSSYRTAEYSMTDLNGRIVLNNELNNSESQINISQLEKGIYFLNLKVDDKSNYYKIIVQ